MGRKRIYASNAEKQKAWREKQKLKKRNVTKHNVTPKRNVTIKRNVTPQPQPLIDKHPSLRLQTAIMLLTDKFPRGNIEELKTQLKTLAKEL